MKRTIILLLAVSLFSHANNSGIQINKVQGGANFGSGTINNNHFDAQLKIVQKNHYNQTVTYTKNITNILQQNPTLLREIKRNLNTGFTSVTTLMQNHSSTLAKILKLSNANSSKQKQIIIQQNQLIYGQKKLLNGQGRLLDGQGRLVDGQGRILYNQEIIVDNQGHIYNMQGQILSNQAHLVDNQGRIINGLGELTGEVIKLGEIIEIVKNDTKSIKYDTQIIVDFINHPEIKMARAFMTDSCTRIHMKSINGVSYNLRNLNPYSTESDKLRCLGELYNASNKNFTIYLKHANRDIAENFSNLSGIPITETISYGGGYTSSGKVIVSIFYKKN